MRTRLRAWLLGSLALVLAGLLPAAASAAQRHAPAAGSSGPPAAAAPRAPAPAPAPSQAPSPASAPRSAGRDSGGEQSRGAARNGDSGSQSGADNAGTAPGRRRGNLPATGEAVARKSAPPPAHGGGGGVAVYPWWYGAGYFGGYYAYDPWFGSYPPYDPGPAPGAYDGDGALKLKVKPVDASVSVDGYYAGRVDDFDGVFQKLSLTAGAHHVEIELSGYEPLSFDVMIQPNQTTTYRGEMVKTRNEE